MAQPLHMPALLAWQTEFRRSEVAYAASISLDDIPRKTGAASVGFKRVFVCWMGSHGRPAARGSLRTASQYSWGKAPSGGGSSILGLRSGPFASFSICFAVGMLQSQASPRSEGRASGNNSGVSLNTNADDLASNTYCRAILMHLQLKPPGLLLSRFWSASTA